MMKIATFGAGCFWGVEERFRTTEGVTETMVGYMGGGTLSPTYEDVCTDRTGHAEVVQLTYDPERITYDELIDIFFALHDPTQKDRQGPDVGTQYRSVIFFHDEGQRAAAIKKKADLAAAGTFKRPVVTAIEPANQFWKAEEYHQKYLMKRGKNVC